MKCLHCNKEFVGLVLPQHDCNPTEQPKPPSREELKRSLMALLRFPEGGVSEMKVDALVSILERLIDERIKEDSGPVKLVNGFIEPWG